MGIRNTYFPADIDDTLALYERTAQVLYRHQLSVSQARLLFLSMSDRAGRAISVDGVNGTSWQRDLPTPMEDLFQTLGLQDRTNSGARRYALAVLGRLNC